MPPRPSFGAAILAGFVLGATLAQQPADAQSDDADSRTARQYFLEAEAAIERGDHDRYVALRETLVDYPLLPYLELIDLRSRLRTADEQEIRVFLRSNEDSPVADSLRSDWLDLLADTQRWEVFQRYYRPGRSAERTCQWLQALLASGRETAVWPEVSALWLSGRSQPEACDPVFASWREHGRLTPALVWERIRLAMAAENPGLVSYLSTFLDSGDKDWAQRWIRADREPKIVLSAEYAPLHPQRNAILAHAVRKLARKDSVDASALWRELRRRYEFDADLQMKVERSLALAANWRRFEGTLADLDRVSPCPEDRSWLESRIRTTLGAQDWEQALTWIEELPEEVQDLEAWRYWKARALEQLGHPREALAIYRELAKERTYYGFLSADRAGLPYRRDQQPLGSSDRAQRLVAALPGARRSYELLRLDRIDAARREWTRLLERLDPEQVLAAAKLAHLWGWPDRAIFTLAKAQYWDDLEIRFPLSHHSTISRAADAQGVDTAWLYAIIRQESAFMEDARSRAGALGLMQLLPATARQVAPTRLHLSRWDILAPETNVRLGAAYLAKLGADFDHHPVLVTAAYNAGPHRVRKWLGENGTPADLWIEILPFRETRTYVRRVLAYWVIYRDRLGLSELRLGDLMLPITPFESTASADPPRLGGLTAADVFPSGAARE